jgi:hypothetical protein
MSTRAQIFVNVLRAQGWLTPAHETVLNHNPEAPWDALYFSGALGVEHIQWALTQADHSLSARSAPVPPAVPPIPVAQAAPPQATTNPKPNWSAAIGKHRGISTPDPVPEVSPVEARAGEMQALSLDDLDNTDPQMPALDLEPDISSSPDKKGEIPALSAPSYDRDTQQIIDLIVENGLGSRAFLEQTMSHHQALEGILAIELSPAQLLIESLAVRVEEMSELAKLSRDPRLSVSQNGALVAPGDAMIADQIARNELDLVIHSKAKNAQAALNLLDIERPLPGLVRHFQQLQPKKNTAKPGIKRSLTVSRGEDKNSSLMPILMTAAVVLGLFAVPFLKSLKHVADDEDEVAATTHKKHPQRPRSSSIRPLVSDLLFDTNPSQTNKVDTVEVESNRQNIDDPGQPVSVKNTVKTLGELNPEKAANKTRAVRLKLAESQLKKAIAALGKESQAEALTLAKSAQQQFSKLGLGKESNRALQLQSDINNYHELQVEDLGRAISSKAIGYLELTGFKGMKLKPIKVSGSGVLCKLSVGGQTDLMWKSLERADSYKILSKVPASRGKRCSLATLALLEGQPIGHKLFRRLWNEEPDKRAELLPSLALVIAPGSLGYKISQGRFVPAGAPASGGTLVSAANPSPAAKGQPKLSRPDPKAIFQGMLASIKHNKAGLKSRWPGFREEAWPSLSSSQQQKIQDALKDSYKNGFKELNNLLEKASRVKVKAALKGPLKELRAAALAGIYDLTLYSDARHGKAGQSEIDRRVQALEKLWDEGSAQLRRVPRTKALKRQVELAKNLLISSGAAADSNLFRATFENVLSNYRFCTGISALDGQLNRRDGLHYDMQVLAYNRGLKGLAEDCRRQVRILNEYRMMQGRHCLALNLKLTTAALGHSRWMEESGKFSHNSTLPGLRDPRNRARAAGYKSPFVGENIAKGQPSAASVHKAWYNSAPHHRNMLRKDYYEIGVAHVGQHWTQLFGSGRPQLK